MLVTVQRAPLADLPPGAQEVAILGVCRTQEQPALRDGVLVNRKKLPLMVTYDHRLLDGAAAARFVNDLKMYVENPLMLLLEG